MLFFKLEYIRCFFFNELKFLYDNKLALVQSGKTKSFVKVCIWKNPQTEKEVSSQNVTDQYQRLIICYTIQRLEYKKKKVCHSV